uniref:Oxidoreductase FAD/NAD(P)-binding domain-containing protein n=1 Tax=Strombidinopsis acuminata TaxID=141414 RepID=A0A7S3T1A9_9SPIT|mmetsp:Transcript_4971/g.6367  ORF Transcript_4971/g.6367 Transcript_4971/m.6367 type:complete len:159 (+) Transcript_4971:506-982(+)
MFESPVGGYAKIRYLGNGEFKKMKVEQPCKYTKLGFIAGGSGITPCFSVMQSSIKAGEKCITEMGLLFSNKTEGDILIKDEIEQLQKIRTDLKVAHTLTRQENVPEGMFKGRITREMIEKTMPAPSDETLIWICGPGPLREHLEKILFEMGYTESMLN